MRQIFSNGRYANVTATMALIVALGGSAYAANSIRSDDIKNGQVKGPDLAGNAVTSGKVKNGSLLRKDFKSGEVPAGPAGAAGPAGPKGDAGPSEGFVFKRAEAVSFPAATDAVVATLNLPAGRSYVLTAGATLGSNTATANSVACELRDDGVIVTSGNAQLAPLAIFSETMTLVGTSDGGVVTLVCNPESSASARQRTIVATRVATLTAQ